MPQACSKRHKRHQVTYLAGAPAAFLPVPQHDAGQPGPQAKGLGLSLIDVKAGATQAQVHAEP
jgi:hypothetical protein